MEMFEIVTAVLNYGPVSVGGDVHFAFLQFLAMAAPLIGKLLGAGGQSAAQNRGTKIDAGLSRDQVATQRGRLEIDQQSENRTERDDAWKQLQRIAYAREQANPAQRPSYLPEQYYNSNAVRRTSQSELDGAQGMERELMARLQGGPKKLNLPALTDVDKLSKPGFFEKMAGWIAPVASGFGAFSGAFGGEQDDDDPWRE